MKLSIACAILSVFTSVVARKIIVHNLCPYTVWPATHTEVGDGATQRGWEAESMTAREFHVPDTWRTGLIWGRRNCDFSKPEGQDCAIGACPGGLECKGPGAPPITVAEFSLRQQGGMDIYDVSVVDGFSIPVRITPSSEACRVAECVVDLVPGCPDVLRGPYDSDGAPLGCATACLANLDGNPSDSPNCCTGQYNRADICPPSGVQFYDHFKSKCPGAYAYAFDEHFLWTCGQEHNSDYYVTFCPFT